MPPLRLWKSSKYYIFWVCVCSLSYPLCIVHAPYYIFICGLLPLPYISTLSHKWHNFKKKLLNKKMCVFSLQCLSETFLSLRRIQQGIITNVHRSSCKVPVILFRFQSKQTWIFLTYFWKILKYKISWISIQCKLSCCTWKTQQS